MPPIDFEFARLTIQGPDLFVFLLFFSLVIGGIVLILWLIFITILFFVIMFNFSHTDE